MPKEIKNFLSNRFYLKEGQSYRSKIYKIFIFIKLIAHQKRKYLQKKHL